MGANVKVMAKVCQKRKILTHDFSCSHLTLLTMRNGMLTILS